MKKLMAVFLSIMMVMALSVSAFAAGPASTSNGNGTITLALNSDDLANEAQTNSYEYKVYRVFDADLSLDGEGAMTGINYKLVSGKSAAPTGFTATNGYITAAPSEIDDAVIEAIRSYVTASDLVQTVTLTATHANETITVPYGYYFITTTTGSLVAIDSTTPNVAITDKNELPHLTKTVSAQTASGIGDDVTYTVVIYAQKGATKYVFHDSMSAGLTPKTGSLSVKVGGADLAAANYTVTKFAYEESDAVDDITITFTESWLQSLTAETPITITYLATINEKAVVNGSNPNNASLDYGDPSHTITAVKPEGGNDPQVFVFDINLTKIDGDENQLSGAKFLVYAGATGGTPLLVARDATGYYVTSNATDPNLITADAANGVVANEIEVGSANVRGFAAGTYYLEEIKAPEGYNMATARIPFTVGSVEDTNGDTVRQTVAVPVGVVNNAGTELPSTGGIGTTLFYVAGAVLVLGAVVLLVSKKRVGADK